MTDKQTSISDVSVALVYNWSGARNSELDIIHRVKAILLSFGHSVSIVDPIGNFLDETGHSQGRRITRFGRFDLVINFHYLNPKFFHGISYVVNWNPLEYILEDPITRQPVSRDRLIYLMDCVRSHDRVLSAGSELLDHYVASVRKDLPWKGIEQQTLHLHTSVACCEPGPTAVVVTPKTFKVFYIGINWEKMSRSKERKIRFSGLFEILDGSGRFNFYGIREQAGIRLWTGIRNYKGELPFDGGKSIIHESRRCGVSLVLHSRQHRNSQLVSTRIFQACAAGTVVISDDNPFIKRYFKDSVLYFNDGVTPEETADNILAVVRWIEQNWDKAQEKARQSHDIFVKTFALEKEVAALCSQFMRDRAGREAYKKELSGHAIRVIYKSVVFSHDRMVEFFNNLKRQTIRNVDAAIYLRADNLPDAGRSVDAIDYTGSVSIHGCGPDKTLGSCILDQVDGAEYMLVYSDGFDWHEDHLLELISACRKNGSPASQAPFFCWYRDLETGLDTTQFFTMGARGTFRYLDTAMIQRMDFQQFPLGNIVFETRLVTSSAELEEKLPLFDLASIAVILSHACDGGACPPARSPVISSAYLKGNPGDPGDAYDEYKKLGESGYHLRQKELNLLLALGRYSQSLSYNLIDAPNPREMPPPSVDLPSQEFTVHGYQDISIVFSLRTYLAHIFRNMPLIVKAVDAAHRVFSRLLRI
ncbi:MAG: hypothetical protein V1793_20490 [Pseudomonadota bacterium]